FTRTLHHSSAFPLVHPDDVSRAGPPLLSPSGDGIVFVTLSGSRFPDIVRQRFSAFADETYAGGHLVQLASINEVLDAVSHRSIATAQSEVLVGVLLTPTAAERLTSGALSTVGPDLL